MSENNNKHFSNNRRNRYSSESQGRRDSYKTYGRNRSQEYRKQPVTIPNLPSFECPVCKQAITELGNAINNSAGEALHFDCAMKQVESTETLEQNEKIIYIGQGRFAIAYYENPADQKRFKLQKIIQFEDREKRAEWRSTIANYFSKI